MVMTEKVKKAREYAIQKHGSQTYGNSNLPYIYHLDGVARNTGRLLYVYFDFDDVFFERALIIAYLHDVLEDTDTPYNEIEKLFGEDVLYILKLLKHEKEESYVDYIVKTMGLPTGSLVKLADLSFNIKQSKKELRIKHNGYNKQRLEKYLLARHIVKEDLDSRNER